MKYLLMVTIFFLSACAGKQAGNPQPGDAAEPAVDGEQLFKTKCAQCHRPGSHFVGPAMAGVESRWKDKQLLYEFVRNSASVIQKDKYAADLFAEWKRAPMLPFPDLTDAEIDAIFDYCNDVSPAK